MSRRGGSKTKALAGGGRLRIGDEWNAISIIAQSQTHPLKAVCELTENALDARAATIHIIRRRRQQETYLEVVDDGQGLPLTAEGLPDFGHIATHVCDSMKRHLAQGERQGIHGEFGIGLLSFWSLSESLWMVSAGADGRLYEMHLRRGQRTYEVRPLRGRLPTGGTRIIAGPLLPATRNVVTGEKLQRYLAAELRDRIRNTGAVIQVVDKVAHKNLIVTPREFSGERLALPDRLALPSGFILVELYLRSDDTAQERRGVAVCKDGTRVLRDLGELDQFQHAPWTEGRLEGVLDCASLNLAPGTRSGIVPDEHLDQFVAAVQALEPGILSTIADRESARQTEASQDILRRVHRAFLSALRELPSNEYLFFDLPAARSAGDRPAAPDAAATDGLAVSANGSRRSTERSDHASTPGLLPLEPGPLASVRILPRQPRQPPGTSCGLTAHARDANGLSIDAGVEFGWQIVEGGAAHCAPDGPACRVSSAEAGLVIVRVQATQDDVHVTDEVSIKFVDEPFGSAGDAGKGLPSYRLEPEAGRPWRSRYDAAANQIVINSAHRDFAASKVSAARHRRYVGKLYAKEVVLINFPHAPPAEVMERLIEITLRTEEVL